MKTLYYSDITNKYYDTVEECEAAEREIEEADAKRKHAEKRVRAASATYRDALNALDKCLDEYYEEYGYGKFVNERNSVVSGKHLAEFIDRLFS